MWLSEQAVTGGTGACAHAQAGTVTIGGSAPAVLLSGECRGLGILAPRGISWRPAAGSQVVVIETDDGERFVAGAVTDGGETEVLLDGEVLLRNGGTWLKLGADGTIRTQGDMYLNGNVYITGRLFLNGKEVIVR